MRNPVNNDSPKKKLAIRKRHLMAAGWHGHVLVAMSVIALTGVDNRLHAVRIKTSHAPARDSGRNHPRGHPALQRRLAEPEKGILHAKLNS